MRSIAIFLLLCLFPGSFGCESHSSWTTESGLRVVELVEGEGAIPKDGDIVSIRYKGWYVGGDEFDNTERLGAPMQFRFGKGELLAGLEEGVATMRKGGKRILTLPPDLAFGKEGKPGLVPPDAWVKFEVELVEIEPGPAPIVPWNDAGMEITVTGTGLQFVDFQVGEGEFPELGSTVIVHYSGFLDDGTLFDTTYHMGYPVEFELSAKTLVPGWVEGLLTMREGGRRKLIVPPFLAYGEKGYGNVVPPNATLIYDVELIEVR